jgi:3alpha(or 20beta)-hydroxysteroid dehydrogenase
MSSDRLAGKVALVSGGARGMGASHARAIVDAGGRVVIGDLLDDEGTALAADLGAAAVYVHLDVTSTEDWKQAVALAESTFGALSVLINNAGILNQAPIEEFTDEAWDKIIAINLTGQFKGIRAATPLLKRSAPSSIINVSSTAGIKGFPGVAGYNASKFGVRGLTKSVAVELAGDGVRVNSVHPGNVNTTMIEGVYDGFPHVPMQRAGEPSEITNLVLFLASDESSFSTGAEFIADGGETTGQPNVFA